MTRVLSGVILAAAAVAAILFLPFLGLRVLACAVSALAANEYLRITDDAVGVSRRGIIVFVMYACWWTALPVPRPPFSLAAVTIAVFIWLAFEVLHAGRAVQQVANDLVALLYIGVPLGMLVAVHAVTGWKGTLLLLGSVVVSDSAQFYSGRAFGRHPLAPAISPKKTIEGAVGGLIVATVFVVVAGAYVFPATPILVRIVLGLFLVVAGICGDLFESRLKRAANLKDSSSLIPGHGGVLDRIDALLFAIPVFYFMVVQGRVA